jgi:hypothetical protein
MSNTNGLQTIKECQFNPMFNAGLGLGLDYYKNFNDDYFIR